MYVSDCLFFSIMLLSLVIMGFIATNDHFTTHDWEKSHHRTLRNRLEDGIKSVDVVKVNLFDIADANICCQAETPICKACHEGISVEEYLKKEKPISQQDKNNLDNWNRAMTRIGTPLPKFEDINGGTIIDVGANVGVFSYNVRKICKDCRIMAFEAVPLFAKYIKTRNIGNIDVYPFGLSDKTGEADFWMSKDGNYGWNTMIPAEGGRKKMKKMKMNFKVFDDLNIDVGNLKLIKIDTEGAEYKVLRGLNKVIQKYKPKLLIEFGFGKHHPAYKQVINEFDKLIDMGYTCNINYKNVRGTTDLVFEENTKFDHSIMITIPTYNRIGYTKFHAKIIREYHKIPSNSLYIFDDCSTEYGEKELREWYGKDIHFFPCTKRLKSDANIRRMFEYFITTDFDLIFSVDTDLIFHKNWRDFIIKHIDSTDGVMSLYHSNAPHHRTFNCKGELCEKSSMGSAGTVMKRSIVKKMLQQHNNNMFDWGFVSIFKQRKIRMMIPNKSLIMHYGQIGQNNGCGSSEVAKGFDRTILPKWINDGITFYFDKCNNPSLLYSDKIVLNGIKNRKKYNVKTSIKNTKREYLLFTSAGDKSNVKQWIGDERLYDIVVIYYGNNDFNLPVDSLIKNKDTKFPNLHKWLKNNDINNYKAIAVWDDDIVASPSDINKLFLNSELFLDSDLADAFVFTPCHTRGNFRFIQKLYDDGFHEVSFIEMNAPIFSTTFLLNFMKNFDVNLKGWGADIWYSDVCNKLKKCRMIVSDNTCVTNPITRADGTREINKAQPEHMREAYWKNLAKKLNISPYPNIDKKSTRVTLKTTIILMGYNTERIPNYKTLFETYGSMTDVIDKIIFIWNNQKDLPPNIPTTDVYVQLVKGETNLLTNRYKMSQYVTTSSIITVDDDVILPRNTILRMLKEYQKNPNLLIGLDDRSYTSDGKYIAKEMETTVNKLVLGKTMMWNKKYGQILFEHKEVVKYVNTLHPGCDDIAMNFLIKSITKKEPVRLLKLERKNLPEIGGLSLKKGWYDERNECVSFMLKHF